MRSILILIFLCWFTNASAQISIGGPQVVNLAETVTYYASPVIPGSYLQWNVSGGSIVQQADDYCMILWDAAHSTGSVGVTDLSTMQSDVLPVMIGGPYIYPGEIYLNYGETPNNFFVEVFLPATFRWEKRTGPATWSTISGATSQSYLPPNPVPGVVDAYRCLVTYNFNSFYTNEVTIQRRQLDPGQISLNQAVSYNTQAVFSSTDAVGGECYPVNYQFSWEQSVEGGPWVQFGNTKNYPANPPVIIGKTLIRRRVICGAETKYTNTIFIDPAYTIVDQENRNYFRSYTIHTRGIQSWYQADQLEIGKKFQETSYFDGLGRDFQLVNKGVSQQANESWQDFVAFSKFDHQGRAPLDYLPYPTASEPGKYKTSTNEQQSFYSTNYNESSPWGRTDFESNPLNRVRASIEEGAYRLNNNIGKTIAYDFNNSNSVNEKVHVWRIGYNEGDLPVGSASDIYQAGTLVKTTISDEKGKKVIEYKDLNGNLVLKKVQLSDAGPGLSNEHAGWLCTYYVYDDFNRQRFIITPKAVAYLDANNWSLNQALADELCYYWEYDSFGRTKTKKSPGSAPLRMVYDRRGNLIFSQDGNQAAKSPQEWLVNFYDAQNRVVSTGIYKSDKTSEQLQADLDITAINTSYVIPAGFGIVDLEVSVRPTVNPPARYAAQSSIVFLPGFESLNGDEFEAEIDARSIPITVNSTTPVNTNDASTFVALTYHYFDGYDYAGVKTFDNSFTNATAYPLAGPDVEPMTKTLKTFGLPTGLKVRVMGTTQFLISTIYYDENGAQLQSIGDNIKNGTEVSTSQYHFDGRLLSNHTRTILPAHTLSDVSVLTKNVYDKIGRIISLEKKFNATPFKTIAQFKYDELGRLKKKSLGQKPGSPADPLETLEYSYNLIGTLTGINKNYALSGNNSDQWNNYFGLHLGYENFESLFANARFDGRVTGMIWKTQGDNTPRKYDINYDNSDRYIGASFNQKLKPSETTWSNTKFDFSESDIQYDENGNLKQLFRKGVLPGNASPLFIDKLTYTYRQSNGNQWTNQLLKVFDDNPGLGTNGNGKLGDFKDEVYNTNNNDYVYDANGNLVIDHNKKIRNAGGNGIIYNHLDKPEKIILENKSTVEYTYDALGSKLSKKVTPVGGTAKTTYYIGALVLEDQELQYILHEEGRLRLMTPVSTTSPQGASAMIVSGNIQLSDQWGVFEYFIKDHLGSTRMVISEETHKEIYSASMETGAASEEERIFGKVDNNGNPLHPGNELYDTRWPKASTNWTGNSSVSVSKLFATGSSTTKSIGPNVLLKVMAGDYVHAMAKYYYDVPSGPVNNHSILQTIVGGIIGGLTGGSVNQSVKDGALALQNSLQDPGMSPLIPFLNNRPVSATNRPKAYLNYVFFDENFNYVDAGSGAALINGSVNEGPVTASHIKAPKNGYAYVYLSNESDWLVYFDDFQVSHERSAIVEETHYYPTGLAIAGISSRSFNKPHNRYGFQGDFSEEESESGYNEFDLRMFDPQISRWIQSDPYDQFAGGYIGMGNDPVNNIDEDGGWSGGLTGMVIGAAVGFTAPYIYENITGNRIENKGFWGLSGAFIGAGVGYGVGASLSDGGSFLNETAAFYKGLFNPSSAGSFVGENRGSVACWIGSIKAEVPNLWGWIGNVKLPSFGFLKNPDIYLKGEEITLNAIFIINQSIIDFNQTNKQELDETIKKIVRTLRKDKDASLSLSGGTDYDGDLKGLANDPPPQTFEQLIHERVKTVIDYIRKTAKPKNLMKRIFDNGKIIRGNRLVTGKIIQQ